MINFKFKSPQEKGGLVKATVHRDGKLGFSAGAATKLDLSENTYFRVATNADDPKDESLYLVKATAEDEDVFKVNKAGEYYYMRLKHVLDELDIDYRDGKVIYDIKKMENGELSYFKLIRRAPISKKK